LPPVRIVHGLQSGFPPLLKHGLEMGAVIAPIVARGMVVLAVDVKAPVEAS